MLGIILSGVSGILHLVLMGEICVGVFVLGDPPFMIGSQYG